MNTHALTTSWKVFKTTLIVLSVASIAVNMFFVYSTSKNTALAQQMEQETYKIRAELLAQSSGDLMQIHSDYDTVQVSHLVIVEPLTVSVSE